MLLLALLYGSAARQSAQDRLIDQPVRLGPIGVRLPRGWTAQAFNIEDGLTVVAVSDPQSGDASEVAVAAVSLIALPRSTQADVTLGETVAMRTSLLAASGDVRPRMVVVDPPRRATVADEPGIVATYGYTLGASGLLGTLRGGDVDTYKTVAAARVPELEDLVLVVEVERFGEWDGQDVLLAKAIADGVVVLNAAAVDRQK